MSTSDINPLRAAFVEARDSSDRIFADYLAGSRPKNPDDAQRRIIALIESMSAAQREDCRLLARHFTERALFKLIVCLEEGIDDHSFQLTSRRGDSDEVHIGDDVDRDLIHAYWRWIAK